MTSWKHFFWTDEDVFGPPAVKQKIFRFQGLDSATLRVDMDLKNVNADTAKVSFNGVLLGTGSESMHKTYDVTNLVSSGENDLRFDYQILVWHHPQGRVTAYVDVVATIVTPTEEIPGWLLPVALIAIIVPLSYVAATTIFSKPRRINGNG